MTPLFSQSTICYLTNVIPSNVSRYIATSNIMPAQNDRKKKNFTYSDTRKLVKHLAYQGLQPEKKIQVFFNFKGGTGKTTVCYHT